MSTTIVRYRVRPDRAAENADLVRAVYAELAEKQPEGFRYSTFVEDDGVSFVHIATLEDGHQVPLPQLGAFKAFLADLEERCDGPRTSTQLTEKVGSYGG